MSQLYYHPQLLALLQTAKEDLEEDGPRLVLADWLEENGDLTRAEFLRLQMLLTPGSSLSPERRAEACRREEELLARYGGAWLGSLWEHGGEWHRGLLSVDLDRLRLPAHLEDMLPWIDSLHFEIPGRDALRWAMALLARANVNHVTLALRRPFPAELLLALLGEAPCSSLLRSLTFRWPPGMGLRTEQGPLVNLSESFFAQLVRLPLCQHLTHLGSIFRLTEKQRAVLRAAGIEPVLAQHPHWPHTLIPSTFRRR